MTIQPTQEPARASMLARAFGAAWPILLLALAGLVLMAAPTGSPVSKARGILWIAIAAIVLALAVVTAERRRARLSRAARGAALLSVPTSDPARPLAHALDDLFVRNAELVLTAARLRREHDAVLHSTDTGVIILDHNQHVTGLSRAAEEMLDLPAGGSRGRLFHEVSRQPELHRFVAASLKGDGAESAEIVLEGRTPRRVTASASPLPDADGRIAGILLVLSDVTRLRRLEAVRSDFAANVSHELRTPITNIRGYIETLLETRLADPQQGMQFLRIAARHAERLGAIVEDMLMLTRLERPEARDQLVREPVRIAAIIEAVQLEQEAEARAKGIRIEGGVPPDLVAPVNPQLLQQAIGNLVNNAVKYGPNNSVVRVEATGRTSPAGRTEVLIEVHDDGPGIPTEHLPRVFERFYRVDKARGREQGGTGLGLAIVKHIAQLHGGSVEVESDLGRGSTFRLMLPA